MPSKSGYSQFYRKPLARATWDMSAYGPYSGTQTTGTGYARANRTPRGSAFGSGHTWSPTYGHRVGPMDVGAGLPAAPRPMMPQAPIENSQAARQALTQDQLTQAGAVSTIPASDFYAATGRLGAVVQAGDEQTRPVIMDRYRERLAKQKARAGMPVQNPAATMVPVAGGFAMMPNDARGAQLGAELEEIARRRALIQQKAQFETAQREARMAGFTPQASYLLGQGDPNVTNAMMFGPRYAADLAQTGAFNNRTMADYDLGRGDLDLRREESAYGMSPEGQRARERGLAIGAGVQYEQYQPYEDSSGLPGQAGPSMQPEGSGLPPEFQDVTSGSELKRRMTLKGFTKEQIEPYLRMLDPRATWDQPDGTWLGWGADTFGPFGLPGWTSAAYDYFYPPGGAPATPRTAPPASNRSPSDQRRRNRR